MTEANHWPNTKTISDPEFRKGYIPNVKWSDREKTYKCEGHDRPFRTFEKIHDHAVTDDQAEATRKDEMEAVIIR